MTTTTGHPKKPVSIRQEEKHTIASFFARAHLDNAERLGLCREQLISAANLSSSLMQETDARILPQQLSNLFQAIWAELDDEYLGFASSPTRVGVFSLISERMIDCKTLGEALHEAQRCYRLISDNITFELKQQQDTVHLYILLTEPEKDTYHMLTELLLMIWHRFPSWLVGDDIPLYEVCFPYARPAHAEEYRLLYPAPCRFQQTAARLSWPSDVLQWPIRRSKEELRRYLKQVPLPWFRKPHYPRNITDQVSRLLEASPQEHLITLDAIATQLHMTSRTIRRKLSAEGSHFQQLKNNLRRDRAIHWLSQDHISLAEVGRRSGYLEVTAFIRAFKGWTGISPGDYRKKLRAPHKLVRHTLLANPQQNPKV